MPSVSRFVPIAFVLLSFPATGRAEVIADWNEKGIQAGVQARLPPWVQARNMAILHIAMFDAVNSIDRRYTPHRIQRSAPEGTSRDAAAAAAAHLALVRLYPAQAQEIDASYTKAIAAIPAGAPKSNGLRLGEEVATEHLVLRANDGAGAPNRYRPHTSAGMYVPTGFPVASSWGQVTPFALAKGSQFRPAAPYSLQSDEWARDYREVQKLGAKIGSSRTAEQTDIARFWEATGPVLHNPVLRQLAATKPFDLLDNARLYALYSVAMADVLIAVFDAKYTYAFWRPVTAIRNGGMGGHGGLEAEAGWEPFIDTPLHPEYPCAHCISSSAAAAVLEAFFGDAVPTFTMSSPTAPGVTRTFSRLSDYVKESIDARVYDGVHYRTSGEVGASMGRKIGEYTVQTQLKPIR